jgi:hypothetical protein
VSAAYKQLEIKMTTVKVLAIAALLVGGTSLALAQAGPPSPGIQPAPQTTAPSPNLQSAAPATRASSGTRIAHRQTTKHKHMYMQGKSTHKHKHLKPAPEKMSKQ